MGTPERNIEAYRIVGEILVTLREVTRRALVQAFGERWFDSAGPTELVARLIARKEREKAVNAYSGNYFTILEYADFLDLMEFHQQVLETASFLTTISPNPQIRQTRMLELQALHDKLAGLRDINEAEVTFLKNFLARVSHAVGDLGEIPHDRSNWTDRSHASQASASSGLPSTPPQEAAPPREPAPPRVQQPTVPAPEPSPVPAPDPHSPLPQPRPAVESIPRQASAALAAASAQRSQAPAAPQAAPSGAGASETGADLELALANGNDRVIIDALYHEVLALSESLLSAGGPRRPKVWEQVVETQWYATRFSVLGMRPLSDYYDLYQSAIDRLRAGDSKAQLQEFLQAHSFSKVVLAVGIFFHQHRGQQ